MPSTFSKPKASRVDASTLMMLPSLSTTICPTGKSSIVVRQCRMLAAIMSFALLNWGNSAMTIQSESTLSCNKKNLQHELCAVFRKIRAAPPDRKALNMPFNTYVSNRPITSQHRRTSIMPTKRIATQTLKTPCRCILAREMDMRNLHFPHINSDKFSWKSCGISVSQA